MLKDIKQTTKHTAVYAIGNIGTKLIGLILIPLYTNANYLSHDDYGALAVLEVTLQLLTSVLTMAMANSLSRWYWDSKYSDRQQSIFFTSVAFLVLIITPVILALLYFVSDFSFLIFSTTQYSYLLKLTFITAGIQVVNNQIFTLTRLQSKSVFYSILTIVRISVNLGLILWGIIVKKRGLDAIWEAYMIGEGIILLMLFPYFIRNSSFRFEKGIIREMLNYGYPLMLASASAVILSTADRYMLNSMEGLEKTGIYSLGYRIANTLRMVVYTSVATALLPLRMKKMNEPDNHRFYSKNLTYLAFVFVVGLLGLSLFALEFLKLFTGSPIYWEANNLVAIISFALLFSSMEDFIIIGLMIKKKTGVLGVLILVTSFLNIGLNLVLIPLLDIYGATLATLLSQAFLFFTVLNKSQKEYFIPYEWRKIFTLAIVALTFVGIGLYISSVPVFVRLVVKSVLFLGFPFVLYFFNFYEKVEIDNIKKIFRNWSKPELIKDNFNRLLKS
ncbi:hypothetical protein D1614_02900 [Maribellus luteus]|uniref:Uncharacterized protein n=1 Tax=Maribellus luteus TaxID=2305463 RepID=A0A399T477_9BACT|nr:oligosaccharide flippase family protein [Maribellus luteus]RIJ49705.1 hypothetical protein D1614_02900 [Maribellus luteus]